MQMKVMIKNVRLAFPRLFVPEPFKDSAPAYSAKFLLEPDSENEKVIRAAIAEVAKEKWADKAAKKLALFQPDKRAFPLLDGDTVDWDGAEGHVVLTARRREVDGAPSVLNRDNSALTEKSGLPYAGCYVDASVDIWAQDGANSGVRCTLRGVKFRADGAAFAGSRPADADEFEEMEDEGDDDLTR